MANKKSLKTILRTNLNKQENGLVCHNNNGLNSQTNSLAVVFNVANGSIRAKLFFG